ncbi:MAG: hypothetical protein F4129_04250 [Acidimicrobiia bacterium]|nr:hypothetical protein [Acidimicrobiia bacterium]
MGSGAATISTQSPPPWAANSSSNSMVMARTVSSHRRMFLGVKAPATSLRSRVWSGASVSISDRRASSASASRSHRLVWPMAEENSSGVRDT